MSQQYSNLHNQQARYIAILLVLLSVISILVMLHHPSVAANNLQEQLQEISQKSLATSVVHGLLIVFVVLISLCLTVYAQRIGLNKLNVLFGLISYWLATFAMINAALIDGFAVPHLAEYYKLATSAELKQFVGLRRLTWTLNQSFANFGSLCWCAAICFWAGHMFQGIWWTKLFGLISVVLALVIAFSLLTGRLSLQVFGMTVVLVVVCAWQIGIAWLLYWQSKG